MRLDDDNYAVRQARTFARQWSTDMALAPETSDHIELAISELVSNAVRHGCPPYRVGLHRNNDTVRGEVFDASQRQPALDVYPYYEGGFGLRVVDATTDRWGVSPEDAGKRVWFEIDIPTQQITVHATTDN
jgi:two-component sensor histidine kinase